MNLKDRGRVVKLECKKAIVMHSDTVLLSLLLSMCRREDQAVENLTTKSGKM